MHLLANTRCRIELVSTYHMDIPLYHFAGSPFPWPKQALIDASLSLERPPGDPQSLANKTYVARLSEGQLAIFNKDGDCYCQLRKRYPEAAVSAANLVASIPSRHGLEDLYNFDGKSEEL